MDKWINGQMEVYESGFDERQGLASRIKNRNRIGSFLFFVTPLLEPNRPSSLDFGLFSSTRPEGDTPRTNKSGSTVGTLECVDPEYRFRGA